MTMLRHWVLQKTCKYIKHGKIAGGPFTKKRAGLVTRPAPKIKLSSFSLFLFPIQVKAPSQHHEIPEGRVSVNRPVFSHVDDFEDEFAALY